SNDNLNESNFRVEEPVEPEDVIWRNLEYTTFSKYARRSISLLVTLLSIGFVVSSAVVLNNIKVNRLANASVTDVITTGRFSPESMESFGISVALFASSKINTWILLFLAKFEKHRFSSHVRKSSMIKLTLLMYLSTISPLCVYVSMNTTENSTTLVESSSFYLLLLSITCVSAFSNVLLEILVVPYRYLKRKISLRFLVDDQYDLNKEFTPARYNYEQGYANHLSSIMIGISFSGVYPLSLYIVCIGLIASYIITRRNIIKLYSKEGKNKDVLLKTCITFVFVSWVIRYLFMFIRMHHLYTLTLVEILHPYSVTLLILSGLYLMFASALIVISTGKMFWQRDHFLTHDGQQKCISEFNIQKFYQP
ncbi:hypothetical protein AKO1_015010, partial [Acrasis kona]